ncbi:hypothetical protein FACS189419_08980 [Planctomycetales bacterium]|nr:hypothetical protein FACS189419_08980 [Planctomycetales bacterium]
MNYQGSAQIPENPQFQPGSYAFGPYQRQLQTSSPAAQTDAKEEGEESNYGEESEETPQTDWEKKFRPVQSGAGQLQAKDAGNPQPVPYLSFVYDKWSHRFHLVPNEQGYAASPSEFPRGTSPLQTWVSTLSSDAIPQREMQYLDYYAPNPVVLPAQIPLRGSRFFPERWRAVPLPVPRPLNAVQVKQGQQRTQLGTRLNRTFGAYELKNTN